MRVGILAVQGAFIEHARMVEKLGAQPVLLRSKKDITNLDALILPGGESTVQGKLIRELDMFEPLRSLITGGLPVLATCAGLILLAEHLSNDDHTYLATLPATVRRNAYGRQLGSFAAQGQVGDLEDFKMTFIRAPIIESVNGGEVLAKVDGRIVGFRSGKQIGLAFHPELGDDTRLHEEFLKLV